MMSLAPASRFYPYTFVVDICSFKKQCPHFPLMITSSSLHLRLLKQDDQTLSLQNSTEHHMLPLGIQLLNRYNTEPENGHM